MSLALGAFKSKSPCSVSNGKQKGKKKKFGKQPKDRVEGLK
jgi:hypothetical protein